MNTCATPAALSESQLPPWFPLCLKDREVNEATHPQLQSTGAGIGSGKEN